MAAIKSLVSLSFQAQAALLLLLVALAAQAQMSLSQSCSAQLSNLNICAPFVVPGAANTNPSTECCGALQSVQQDCLCNTLRIASRLPSQCNLPAHSCGQCSATYLLNFAVFFKKKLNFGLAIRHLYWQ